MQLPDYETLLAIGATGHIGSALCGILLQRGEPVTVVTRSED